METTKNIVFSIQVDNVLARKNYNYLFIYSFFNVISVEFPL